MKVAGQWIEIERIWLSEVTQAQEYKDRIFFLLGDPSSQSLDVSIYPGVTAETGKVEPLQE